jgi:ABC-type branched-subunit amino acid transport system ATPase component
MSTNSGLEVRNVSVSFGGVHALRDVTLSARPGQRVGLIGPNGAGKTTLINVIAGGQTPTKGEVFFEGRSVGRLSAAKRARQGLSRTFQNLELFGSMSVYDNVLVGLDAENGFGRVLRQLRTSKARKDRAREALARFGIEEYAAAPVESLPYGIRKLVELSRAFVREPRFLLLDEPVAGLSDPASFLARLNEGIEGLGCGVLLIEHDMGTVQELCEHVYVLDSGAIIAEGEYAEVASDPRVIDAYLGSPA